MSYKAKELNIIRSILCANEHVIRAFHKSNKSYNELAQILNKEAVSKGFNFKNPITDKQISAYGRTVLQLEDRRGHVNKKTKPTQTPHFTKRIDSLEKRISELEAQLSTLRVRNEALADGARILRDRVTTLEKGGEDDKAGYNSKFFGAKSNSGNN